MSANNTVGDTKHEDTAGGMPAQKREWLACDEGNKARYLVDGLARLLYQIAP